MRHLEELGARADQVKLGGHRMVEEERIRHDLTCYMEEESKNRKGGRVVVEVVDVIAVDGKKWRESFCGNNN